MGPACETEPTGDSRDTAEGLPRAEAGAPALLRVPGLRRAVAFLALLELRKQNEVAIAQAAPFAPIRISRADAERSLSWTAHSA